jgi:anti-sigma regulatory factor (Ser/Thr protein kinase)
MKGVPVCTDHDEGFDRSFPAGRLGPGAEAVADGRRYVRDRLAELGAGPELVETAALLASEVITNAVRYAPPPLSVRVHQAGDRIRIAVADRSAAPPVARAGDATGGWGLHLVARGAADWGHHRQGPGKCVWFELDLKAQARPPAAALGAG